MPPTPTPQYPDSPNDGSNAHIFDNGTKSSNGNGQNGHGHGSNAKRNKKKNKSKRDSSSTSPIFSNSDALHSHKRVHDEDTEECPHKKQRVVTAESTWSRSILCVIAFAIGTFVTLPLVFSTCTLLGCGGGTNVKSMVDLVVLKKRSDGEKTSFGDLMKHLQSIPSSNVVADTLFVEENSKRKGRNTVPEDQLVPIEFNIQESMCQVSYIAIGQFVHYLPYVQLLVLRNPFSKLEGPTFEDQSSSIDPKRRKGLLKRIVSKHKEKHHDEGFKSAASEEIDRQHPLRHILEGASIFFHHRKQKKMERKEKRKKKKAGVQLEDSSRGEVEVDWSKWKFAMSDDYDLKSEEISLIKELAERVKSKDNTVCKDNSSGCNEKDMQIISLSGGSNLPNKPFQERINAVPWGGIKSTSNQWWSEKESSKNLPKISAHSEGGRLLAAYLKIMKWPKDLYAKYPFRLCKDGCDAEVSLLHTLEWREKYKPWCTSKNGVKFNKAGFIYSRGHSKPGPKQRLETEKSNMDATSKAAFLAGAGHSMVWYRPGLASPTEDPELYGRTMINVLENAISDSLVRNGGTIGRFNVVMDCAGMSSKNSPSIANVKKLFSVLQDHFPDRLGVLLAANLSGLTQMLMKMVLPFVTEDVRAKIHIIPNGEDERREMLLQFMDESEVPYFLGGKDSYDFDAGDYYEGRCILSEEDITEYRSTMPYHA